MILNGNNSAATSQSVGSLTLANGGSGVITLNPGTGQDLVLNLNAITRAINSQDGTVRFNLPSGTQSATNGITTDTLNTLGTGANAILGGWATVNDGTGTFFARNLTNAVDGNIVAALTASTDAVASWLTGENISDSTGFTGTVNGAYLNSLRFNAASGSDLALSTSGVLGIASGGILVTDNVGGTPSLAGGTLFSGAQASNVPELIITQDSAATFEISSAIRTNSTLVKSGSGTLLLSGNNTYTGNTTVENGILQLSGGNAIGDTSVLNFGVRRQNTVQLLADETIGGLAGGQRQTELDFGIMDIGSHTLTINQAAGTTFSGRLSGAGTIVMASGTGNFNYNGQTSTGLFSGSVVVNSGLFQLSGATARLGSATAFTINGAGNFLLDNNDDTNITDRISDTATFTLNSASGAFSGQTIVRGLANRNNDDDDAVETIGATTFNSGANYLSLESTSTGTNSAARIVSTGWTRDNAATLNVRGTNLGVASGQRTQFKVQDANDAAMLAANIGGGGTIGGTAKNVSIIPWAIGETVTAGVGDGNMGNTFLSYVDNRGLVPLSLTNEFSTFGTAAAGDNVRESLGADFTGIAGATVNSLILNNIAFAGLDVIGSGAGQSLALTSGTLLFTVTGGVASTAYDTTLGGFDSGITVGGTTEYVISVVNPSSATTTPTLTATIASPLTSAADITKSGRGTLILNQINTAGGGANKTTLNEGFLQISDLDQIGGNTGNLVFAGGGLRLGNGLTDDISSRTITFLPGGGTIDTNGIDLALANSVGSGLGGLTKVGAGNLTLNAAATYTGPTTISAGTLTLGANNATGNGGNLTVGGGATLALGTNSLTAGLVTTSGASPAITGTGTLTASSGFAFTHTGNTQIDAVLAGSGRLFKNQTNTLTLTGSNTYTGTTEIQNGTLSFNSIDNVGGGASALGNPGTAEDGVIRLGLTTASTTLTYTGSGHSSNRLIGMQGTTGGVTLNGNGTGGITYGGARFENAGNKTLTLRGDSNSSLVNTIGSLTELGGVLTLNKTDANTWMVNGASSYTGATQIDNGILMIGLTDALPTGTAVRIGTGATAGTLDLNGFDQTIGSLLVQTNSDLVTNQIIVDSGKTLTINGAVSIGTTAEDGNTNLNALGGGSLVVNSGNANFIVGTATGAANSRVDVDFTGLNSFTANLGTGFFRLGDPNTDTEDNPSTFKLAVNNTITAASIRIGDGSGGGVPTSHTLTLGSGTNTMNADTFNVGSAGSSIRSGGTVVFDAGDTTGTLTLRASNGTDRATINLINTTGSTAGNMESTLNLAGHTSDILASTLTMASRTQNTGAGTATLTFDQGTLDITTLNMASRTGTGTGNATATVNLGDSAVPGLPTTNIGTLNMAVNTGAGGIVTADFNVTGGSVTIGTGSGTAINMANAAASRIATSNITLTGGAVNVTGNVIRNGGAGAENATVTLNGATLNMSGYSMGTSGQSINFAAQAGSLSNLGELNGGGALEKTSSGTLVLGDGNLYSGGTLVSAGTLLVNNTSGSGTGSGDLSVAIGGTLGGSGIVASSNTSAAVTIQGLLDVGNPGDTGGADLAFNLTGGSSSISLGGIVQLDLWSGLGLGGGVGTAFSDQLWLSANSIDLTGSTLKLTNSSGMSNSTFAVGDTWKLFDWNSVAFTGSFSNITSGSGNFLDLPDLDPYGLAWDTSALYTTGHIAVGVPEPSRTLLLMVGLLCFGLRRRRRL